MKNTMPPDRFLSELNRAIALHQQNRLVEAELIYRELLRLDSRHFDVVHLLGTLLRRTGALTESMSLLDRAVKMRPQSAAAQLNRANVLMDRGAFADALAGFSRAIALKPDYAEAYHGRAVALLKLGNPQSARADTQAALKLNPGILEAALTLGQSLAAEERLVEARDVFLRLLAQRPAWPEAMLELGHVLLRLNQAGKAAEVLVRARQLDPTRPGIAFELALALRDLGHTQQALLVVEQALAHPWLAPLHDPATEPSTPGVFKFDFEGDAALDDAPPWLVSTAAASSEARRCNEALESCLGGGGEGGTISLAAVAGCSAPWSCKHLCRRRRSTARVSGRSSRQLTITCSEYGIRSSASSSSWMCVDTRPQSQESLGLPSRP